MVELNCCAKSLLYKLPVVIVQRNYLANFGRVMDDEIILVDVFMESGEITDVPLSHAWYLSTRSTQFHAF
jgi:hypothetical protein